MTILKSQQGLALPLALIFTVVAMLGLLVVMQFLTSEYKGNSIRTEQIIATAASEGGIEEMVSLLQQKESTIILNLSAHTCQLPDDLTQVLNGFDLTYACTITGDHLKLTSQATDRNDSGKNTMQTTATFLIVPEGNQIKELTLINWESMPSDGGL
ncbi:hypothetical protein [Alkalihalobacillus pseudalcaliphilus]|uniref:hypothetical protein n=1 Tax=Alkalihalobacillus pseudalcaliphilus TaxID=79884 RepID=UPI00064DC995|nr:hypothetical protein [Alkalihalobacillus pseudalcaliphilus]KMK74654.1 hypothetical protein AB990_19350 [Alkalihalobacillus pseudalcaliphilus]